MDAAVRPLHRQHAGGPVRGKRFTISGVYRVKHPILGLHHVTATVNEAQPDLDFYTDLLGLRLVKKTVNFDNHNVYHFYYGDERGTPGTLWTTFPYAGWGVAPGRHGEGQITTTSFSVPVQSLAWWTVRLENRGVAIKESGTNAISFQDPSGLIIQLRGAADDRRTPWSGSGITPDVAIRGLESVTLTIAQAGPTVTLLTDLLGFSVTEQNEHSVTLGVNGSEPGKTIRLRHSSGAPPARNGLGTVHHVALGIASGEEQLRLRSELVDLGFTVTPVLDRQYFHSIYFREPGGVLLEVATVGPGFSIDEPVSDLGRELKLPPWEETHRAAIEQALPPISLQPLLRR